LKAVYFFSIIFILSRLAVAQGFVYGDKEIREVIKSGLDKSYNFEFAAAEKIYTEVKKNIPTIPPTIF